MYEYVDTSTVFDVEGSREMMVELYASLLSKRLIFVPKEPSICPVFHQPVEPELYCDKNIERDKSYIVAGMGVVAGEEAYRILNDSNTILSWE